MDPWTSLYLYWYPISAACITYLMKVAASISIISEVSVREVSFSYLNTMYVDISAFALMGCRFEVDMQKTNSRSIRTTRKALRSSTAVFVRHVALHLLSGLLHLDADRLDLTPVAGVETMVGQRFAAFRQWLGLSLHRQSRSSKCVWVLGCTMRLTQHVQVGCLLCQRAGPGVQQWFGSRLQHHCILIWITFDVSFREHEGVRE